VHEDFWSTRIDISCPRCRQMFKVRLRKLQFGSELVCRLCRHEFEASSNSDLPEVQTALAHMKAIVEQRLIRPKPHTAGAVTTSSGRGKDAEPQADRLGTVVPGSVASRGSSDP
jgi:transcription elongation factor Elf1